jgi:hypothetical protein
MKKNAVGAWLRRNQLPPREPSSRLPPYKPPRQNTVTEIEKDKTSAEVIEIQDSEDIPDKDKDDDESQTETQFGLVWERYEGPQAESEADKIKDSTIKAKQAKSNITHVFVPETEEQGSDCEEDNIPFSELKEKKKSDKQQQPIEFSEMIVAQEPTDKDVPDVTQDIGRRVAKQFVDGVYKGEVISKTGKRGRFLYKILYEDGDGEDLNEKEFKKACMLYDGLGRKSNSDTEDSDNDKWSYNSDIEVSEYSASDEESKTRAKKKKKQLNQMEKRRKKNLGGNQ